MSGMKIIYHIGYYNKDTELLAQPNTTTRIVYENMYRYYGRIFCDKIYSS